MVVRGEGNDGISLAGQQQMNQVRNLVAEFKNTFLPLYLQ